MAAAPSAESLGLRDPDRGRRNLDALARHLGTEDFAALAAPLARLIPRAADADMALNNLEQLLATPAARTHLPGLLEHRGRGLEQVLLLLATSQFFADTLSAYPEALDAVRQPARRNPTTGELTAALRSEVDAAFDDAGVLRAIRRFRHLQMLRIGVNDLIRERSLEEVTRDLSRLADASIEVALQTAIRTVGRKFGLPTTAAGTPARIAVIGFGKLGGDELNYSSDIDLMFIYDADGQTSSKRVGSVANAEFFARVVTEVVRLLSSHTDRGFAYRVDLRLRPEGQRGPLARSLPATLSYYDAMGRTWERQALIKLRPVAGDLELGREFAAAIDPFVYRKYFSFSEINEVKALKRRMEQAAARGGTDERDVKTGRGGIRDIEYAVQFLQLLNGGDLPAVRQRNTLLALEALEIAGCLTSQETYILADAYKFLRKVEHRLQLLFDWQTHKLPATAEELGKLAIRMGYRDRETTAAIPDPRPPIPTALSAQKRSPLDEAPTAPVLDTRTLLVEPLDLFLKDYHDKTRLDRAILDHLLHQTFSGAGERSEPEADLILDPDPDDATVAAVLGRYPFRDPAAAYQNLSRLARESVRFLSHRRCRHFLASIAPQLLRAVSETPDPDRTLNDLERVTASLGGKAVLYELFSVNPPSLKLVVDICASSPYLIGILTSNPGMIDELLDSLVLDRPRSAEELRGELTELLRGANDPDPILHSFQDKELLRVGVRDLLGKDAVRETTAALSDLAETVLNAVFERSEPAVRTKHGVAGRYVVLGLGKLGGREIGYHSDLDLILVYEADGPTTRPPGHEGRFAGSSNSRYFTDLAQRAIKHLSAAGPLGRLYEVDMRLRPTGKSGSLTLPLSEFRKYFAVGGGAGTWERQSMIRARVVRGDADFAWAVTGAIREAVLGPNWSPAIAAEVRGMRAKLESTAGPRSLKRGRGGLADIEFAVQLLVLKYGRTHPTILQPNVWDALEAIELADLIPKDDVAALRAGYTFLRAAEARLRLVTDRPLTELPENRDDRDRLARQLGFANADAFQAAFAAHADAVRSAFERIAGS